MFFKIVERLIRRDDTLNAQKILFSKNHFLTRMIEHYNKFPKSALVGHVLDVINLVRLTASLQPAIGYFRTYLNTHVSYRAFYPKLQELTLIQAKKYADLDLLEDSEDEQSKMPISLKTEEDFGMEIGSSFAKRLGFAQDAIPQQPEQPKKQKKKSANHKKQQNQNQEEDEHVNQNSNNDLNNNNNNNNNQNKQNKQQKKQQNQQNQQQKQQQQNQAPQQPQPQQAQQLQQNSSLTPDQQQNLQNPQNPQQNPNQKQSNQSPKKSPKLSPKKKKESSQQYTETWFSSSTWNQHNKNTNSL